jgi:hypothetical protein
MWGSSLMFSIWCALGTNTCPMEGAQEVTSEWQVKVEWLSYPAICRRYL